MPPERTAEGVWRHRRGRGDGEAPTRGGGTARTGGGEAGILSPAPPWA